MNRAPTPDGEDARTRLRIKPLARAPPLRSAALRATGASLDNTWRKIHDPLDNLHRGEGQKKRLVDERLAAAPRPHLYSSSYVPKELLADSLAMADLGVVAQLPGQERVCYPSKLLGVMAAGRATLAICPPDCEMARMIREHDLGFVVPNGDLAEGRRVLLAAKADPERVRRMGENAARLLRENFTLAKAAKSYYSLLTQHRTH